MHSMANRMRLKEHFSYNTLTSTISQNFQGPVRILMGIFAIFEVFIKLSDDEFEIKNLEVVSKSVQKQHGLENFHLWYR